MYELKLIDDNTFSVPEWINDIADYNHLPEPSTECDIQDFYSVLETYAPRNVDYRQISVDGKGYNVAIFFFHDQAFALLMRWKEKVRCFRIGCDHIWKELSAEECMKNGIPYHGCCWHVLSCPICKTIRTADSSD